MLLSTYIAYLVETAFSACVHCPLSCQAVPVFPGQQSASDLTTKLLTQQVCRRYVQSHFANCGFL